MATATGVIRVTTRLDINNGNLQYSGRPSSFVADQDVARGPTPGIVLATVAGTVVSLAALTTPGVCRIQNQDLTNYIEYGMSDGTYFYPLGEALAGESWVVRLHRRLGKRDSLAGTGSTSPLSFMVRADTASCYVLVEAFNK